MNPHVAWYAARAAGLVAWGLVSISVIWGLLISTRLFRARPKPAWVLDLHRFLGGLSVTFTAVHVVALIADNTVRFDVLDVLVPFASSWRPGAVALGVVTFWMLVAVEATSLLMRKVPRRFWRIVHLSSYALFWAATLHLLWAGTDARHPLVAIPVAVLAATVVFLTLVVALSPKRGARTPARPTPATRSSAPGSPAPVTRRGAAPGGPSPRPRPASLSPSGPPP